MLFSIRTISLDLRMTDYGRLLGSVTAQ